MSNDDTPWKFVGKSENIILDGATYERVMHFISRGWKLKGLKRTLHLCRDGHVLTEKQFWETKL